MSKDAKIQHWDSMYNLPLEDIPWEIEEPPKELIDLVELSQITGGKALDIACGTGNYSFYLAKHGFRVVGVDFSNKALAIARKRNQKLRLQVEFKFADITKIIESFPDQTFDFILDYSILHHLELAVTKEYAKQCIDLLKPKGKLLLLSFSDKDKASNDSGSPVAVGKFGNTMYYRTADEIRQAYQALDQIYYIETTSGKRHNHVAHCFLFQKH